jgi:hypothetical protein
VLPIGPSHEALASTAASRLVVSARRGGERRDGVSVHNKPQSLCLRSRLILPAHLRLGKRVVEERYGVDAEYVYTVPLRHFLGTVVWEGPVHVFSLKNHPTASRAFAWSESTGTGVEHHVALDSRAVPEAAEAVRLALR